MNFEKLSKLLQECKNPYTSPYTENVFVIHDWYAAMTVILARAALKHGIRKRKRKRKQKRKRNTESLSMIEN